MRLRWVLVAALPVVATGLATAQHQDRVLIDLVIEAPRAAGALTPSEVAVSDGDGPLPVVSVSPVEAGGGTTLPLPTIATAADERLAAARATRLVGIFLDEYHLSAGAPFEETRAALAQFVRTGLGPRDLVAVVRPLDPVTEIRLTGDREAAASRIEAARPREGDYTPASAAERDLVAAAPARAEEARAQIATAALHALSTHLAQFVAGRKTLLVASDGFEPSTHGRRGDLLPGLDSVLRTATRGRVAVYAFMPGLPGPGSLPRAAALRQLASDTSGLAVIGSAGVRDGLAQAADDAVRYHVISLEPRPSQRDGQVHRVDVRLRRTGARVRARAGFSVAPPVDAYTPPAATTVPASRLVPRRASPLIRPWFGLAGGASGRVRVTMVWEPAGPAPGSRAAADATPRRVRVEAVAGDGSTVFTGSAVATGTASLATPDAGDAARLSFETVPGPLLLQTDILDGAGRVLDRDVRDLPIRPFAGPLAFGTPAVYRARTVRELRGLIDTAEPPPVAARQFSRTEHIVVRVPVVGQADAEVEAALVSAYGSVMRQLPVRRTGADGTVAQVDFALAGLAPGGYVVRFGARGPGASATERLAFTLTP